MKNFIITKRYDEDEVDQIPVVMELYQYNPNASKISNWNNDIPKGSVGNQSLVYSIDCSWSSTNNLKKINEIHQDSVNPTITRSYLSEKFFVFIIPDYGHQAMSPLYQDFIPYIFNSSGKKLNQGAVGMLRIFTKKQAFILLDRDFFDETEVRELVIRIVFKNNIEKADVFMEIPSDTRYPGVYKITKDTKGYEDFLFTDLTDYDLFFQPKNSTIKYKIQNYGINFLNVDINVNGGKWVRKQGRYQDNHINTNKIVTIKDYFTQAMQNDLSSNKGYKRNIDYTLTFDIGVKDAGSLFIRSKQHNIVFSEGIVGNQINISSKLSLYNINDFLLFNGDGEKIPASDITLLYNRDEKITSVNTVDRIQNGSLIAEFNNCRKILITSEDGLYSASEDGINLIPSIKENGGNINKLIQQILFSKKIFAWAYQENSEILLFKDKCLIPNPTIEDLTSGNIELIIFDRFEYPEEMLGVTSAPSIFTLSNGIEVVATDEISYADINGTTIKKKIYDDNEYCILYDPYLLIKDENLYTQLETEIFLLNRDNELGMEGLWFDDVPNTNNNGKYNQFDIYYQNNDNIKGVSIYRDSLEKFKGNYESIIEQNKKDIQVIFDCIYNNKTLITYIYSDDINGTLESKTLTSGNLKKINDEIENIKDNLWLLIENSDLSKITPVSESISRGDFFFIHICDETKGPLGANNYEGPYMIDITDATDGNLLYREFGYDNEKKENGIFVDKKSGKNIILPLWDTTKNVKIKKYYWSDKTLNTADINIYLFK